MATDKGWIKVSRRIKELPFWNDAEKVKAFLDLHMMANYKDTKFIPRGNSKVITVHAGQIFTSMQSLAGQWGWSKKRVLGYIEMLKSLNLCTTKGYAKGTLITLVDIDDALKQGTAEGTAKDTPEDTAEVTPEGTAKGTRLKKEIMTIEKYNKILRTRAETRRTPWGGTPK